MGEEHQAAAPPHDHLHSVAGDPSIAANPSASLLPEKQNFLFLRGSSKPQGS
jgi:hypothetical protein